MIRLDTSKHTPLKLRKRLRNKARIRKKIMGTEDRPRLVVFRSHRHIYAQLINDISGQVLACASTLTSEDTQTKSKQDLARLVGQQIAKRALDKKIKQVVFDRSGFIYHGRVKTLAMAARETGLIF